MVLALCPVECNAAMRVGRLCQRQEDKNRARPPVAVPSFAVDVLITPGKPCSSASLIPTAPRPQHRVAIKYDAILAELQYHIHVTLPKPEKVRAY